MKEHFVIYYQPFGTGNIWGRKPFHRYNKLSMAQKVLELQGACMKIRVYDKTGYLADCGRGKIIYEWVDNWGKE